MVLRKVRDSFATIVQWTEPDTHGSILFSVRVALD